MAAQDLFHLVRIDVCASTDDGVLDAADYVHVAVGVDEAEVAHVHPAIRPHRAEVLAPIARLDRRTAHADLTHAARGHRRAFGIADHHLQPAVRPPHRLEPLLVSVLRAHDRELPRVHRAVEVAHAGAGRPLPIPGHGLGEG